MTRRLSPPALPRKTIDFSIVVCGCALALLASGCRSRAKADMYRQKMASEIRVLEDQLYDADYQNRVLRDQIESLQQANRAEKAPPGNGPTPAAPPSGTGENTSGLQDSPTDEIPVIPELPEIDLGEDLTFPDVDPGDPAPSEGVPGSGEPPLVPPSEPEPPGKEDTTPSAIEAGDIVPPPANEDEQDKPPGQIQLPDSVQAKTVPIPTSLRIHKTLSGGHQSDEAEETDGMFLVINVLDQLGKMVDVDQYEVDADLTIVVLDPTREPSEARIGRWSFTPEEVRSLARKEPVSGIHVPIQWQDKPASEEVIVHARLRSDEDEMRCEQKLSVKSPEIARWTPRGDRR